LQTTPQPPQSLTEVVDVSQPVLPLPQWAWFPLQDHTHMPPEHDAIAFVMLHAWPQAPQLAGSLSVLAHMPLQHVAFAAHGLPHMPQFCSSVLGSTHLWLQHVRPPGQFLPALGSHPGKQVPVELQSMPAPH
jgi:hypothetical protein